MFLQTLLGVLSFACSIFFYLSPISLLYQIIKNKQKIESTSCFVVFCMLFNGTVWFFYCVYSELEEGDFNYLKWCNFGGMVLSFLVLLVYLFLEYGESVGMYMIYIFNVCNLIFEVYWLTYDYINNKKFSKEFVCKVIRNIASVFNVAMYVTPGLKLGPFLRTLNHKYIIFPIALLGLFNSLMWILFAFSNKEKYGKLGFFDIYGVNIIGLVVCLIQVIYYIVQSLRNKDKKDEENSVEEDDKENKRMYSIISNFI